MLLLRVLLVLGGFVLLILPVFPVLGVRSVLDTPSRLRTQVLLWKTNNLSLGSVSEQQHAILG